MASALPAIQIGSVSFLHIEIKKKVEIMCHFDFSSHVSIYQFDTLFAFSQVTSAATPHPVAFIWVQSSIQVLHFSLTRFCIMPVS